MTVPAGSFLFVRPGAGQDNDVRLFVPTGVGAGRTAGSVSLLIEGDELGIGSKVFAFDLVEAPTAVGGQMLPAGTLLLAVDGSDPAVGASGVAATQFDVLALSVTRTTLGSGQAAADASVLFRGSDVGLDTSAEAIHGLTLLTMGTPPVAADDGYSVLEDQPLAVLAPGVLANDGDPDGDPLTAALRTPPAHGTASLSADGSFTYVPAANYFGTDSFTYAVADGTGGSAVGTVAIDVTPVNDAPVAADDGFVVGMDQVLIIPNPGVLANDADPDGDLLTVAVVAGPANGQVLFSPGTGGGFLYQPAPGFVGTDTFTYVATDPGGALSNPAVVTITVLPPNGPIVAGDDAYTTPEDTPLSAGPVLVNDADPDGEPVTAVLVSGPANGTLRLNPDGTFVYVPAPDFFGTDTFTMWPRTPPAGSPRRRP